ncbi:unnamed protein product, partial [Ceratitis capitata]
MTKVNRNAASRELPAPEQQQNLGRVPNSSTDDRPPAEAMAQMRRSTNGMQT